MSRTIEIAFGTIVALGWLLGCAASAAPILVPYEIGVSASYPNTFEIFNPSGPGGTTTPVELFTVAPQFVSGAGSPVFAVYAVLSTSGSTPNSVGLVDLYYDGPADGFPVDGYYKVIVTVTTADLVAGEVYAPPALVSPKEIIGRSDFAYDPPAPALITHDFISRIDSSWTNVVFDSIFTGPREPGSFDVFYGLSNPGGLPVDVSQPVIRVELRVSGVPEPAGMLQATIAVLGLLVVAWRTRCKSLGTVLTRA